VGCQRDVTVKESEMHATAAFPVVGVDLSKHVFELAVADERWQIVERARLSRSQFERWFANRTVGCVVMESCGSAHHWGRWLAGLGIAVTLLPAQYVRAYVKRNTSRMRGTSLRGSA
jgi:transposase